MSEAEEGAELVAFMETFVEQTEARSKEMASVQQEIDLLSEQIKTKTDHVRQLSEQRNNLFGKNQSLRNDQQDAALKCMTDWVEMMTRDNQS